MLDRHTTAITMSVAAGVFSVAALSLSVPSSRESWWFAIPVRAAGLVGIGIGAVAWSSSTRSALGRLAVAAGAAYYLGELRAATSPVIFAVGFCLAYLWTAVVAHLVLAFPAGGLVLQG